MQRAKKYFSVSDMLYGKMVFTMLIATMNIYHQLYRYPTSKIKSLEIPLLSVAGVGSHFA